MLAATLLTLLFVPVFYAVIEEMREGRDAQKSGDASHPVAAE
jgi:HAE1 family hydrophobic/amphiphilic exporter-1